jgi:hypothetical protein
LEWNDNGGKPRTNYDYGLKSIDIITADKYKLKVEVTQTIQIKPDNAPKVVLTVGGQGTEDIYYEELSSENQNQEPEKTQHELDIIEEKAKQDATLSERSKSKSIKALVTKVLGITIQRSFAAAAAKYNAIDFISKNQKDIRTEIIRDIKDVLVPRGVIAIDTSFRVDFKDEKNFDKALKELIDTEHRHKQEIREIELGEVKDKRAESSREMIRSFELNKLRHDITVKYELFNKLKDMFGVEWASEVEKNRLAEEVNIALDQEKLKQLREKVEIEGGPLIPIMPELFKNLPRQFEHLNNVVLSDKALESVGNSPWQMILLELLSKHLRPGQLNNSKSTEESES